MWGLPPNKTDASVRDTTKIMSIAMDVWVLATNPSLSANKSSIAKRINLEGVLLQQCYGAAEF